ncbi:MAG TPA: DUF5678 domain-containing protein [Chloroflexota bacterium]|nr:DUF5678 domain-containing protein [Chloroflexota bacterium]
MKVKLPTREDMQDMIKRGEEERAYWARHYGEYREKYPDQYVLVRDGKLIATARDLDELEALRDAGRLDAGNVWVQFMADPDEPLIV